MRLAWHVTTTEADGRLCGFVDSARLGRDDVRDSERPTPFQHVLTGPRRCPSCLPLGNTIIAYPSDSEGRSAARCPVGHQWSLLLKKVSFSFFPWPR